MYHILHAVDQGAQSQAFSHVMQVCISSFFLGVRSGVYLFYLYPSTFLKILGAQQQAATLLFLNELSVPYTQGRQSVPKSGRSERGGERNFGVIFALNRGFLL